MAASFGSRIYRFYTSLVPPRMPVGVRAMNPYRDRTARRYVKAYLDAFYGDARPRLLAFGINPGRFGAGITGVTFTDPVALADFCGIPNDLPRRRELSSVFVYDVIERLGGVRAFTARSFLTAAAPLGFTRGGVNLNYYDVPALARACEPFIVTSVERHLAFGGRTDRAIVLGAGQNFAHLKRLNDAHGWFGELVALDHPRFILQYRRKRVAEYVERYVEAFSGG
ncbi:MAG TPA: uracil-DNA glycosylase family protein [Gemmatimonadaceae bacterium]|nr:uracil-DNA glycosylase family protein [Gemmatimonadaceae bacterium]